MQNSSQFPALASLFFGVTSVLLVLWRFMIFQQSRAEAPTKKGLSEDEVDTTWMIEVPFEAILSLFDGDKEWLEEHRGTFSLQEQRILVIDRDCRGWFGWYNHEAVRSVIKARFKKRFFADLIHGLDELPDFLLLQQQRWNQMERHFQEEFGRIDPDIHFHGIEESIA